MPISQTQSSPKDNQSVFSQTSHLIHDFLYQNIFLHIFFRNKPTCKARHFTMANSTNVSVTGKAKNKLKFKTRSF